MDFNLDNNVSNDIEVEILTFGKFLKIRNCRFRKIKIPIYQREYRWERITLVNLMIDVKNILGSNIHNIGTKMTIDERTRQWEPKENHWSSTTYDFLFNYT